MLNSLFKKSNKNKLPKTVQESIPYTYIYPNGVIETDEGTFTKAYELQDINFKNAPEDEQKRIFYAYQTFLSSFSTEIDIQVLIINNRADKKNIISELRLLPKQDGLNTYRSDMNKILLDKIIAARNSLEQKKYLVVSLQDENVAHAMYTLEGIEETIKSQMLQISRSLKIEPQTTEDRLRIIYQIYHQENEISFYNAEKDGKKYFDLKTVLRQGLTTKDVIGPSGFDFKYSSFHMGDSFGRSMYLSGVPAWLSTDFLSEIAGMSMPLSVSINYTMLEQDKAIRMVKDKMLSINAEIAGRQKAVADSGYGYGMLSPALSAAQEQTLELMKDLAEKDQKLYFTSIVITVFAESKEELEYNTKQIIRTASGMMCPIRTLYFQQEKGLNATLPLGINKLEVKRLFTTQSASVFLPFTAQELRQKNGIFYGINETTHNIIAYNRLLGHNHNSLIFGDSGSGKSVQTKAEMIFALLRSEKNYVYVIDPEAEYVDLAKALKGEEINIAPGSKTYLNPLDMDLDYDGESDPLSLKCDYILGMIDIMLGNDLVLDAKARSIVSRCIKLIYRPYLEHLDELRMSGENITKDITAMPTILTLYNKLMEQEEPEARSVAAVLEMYTDGSMPFAGRTNVDTDSRMVVYNTRNLGTGTKNLGLYICLNDIWLKMSENAKKDIWTWVYIDEFHEFLRIDSVAKFIASIWARARKRNGVPCGITQNTEDLLRNADARKIMNNTNFITLLSMQSIDKANIAELLQIPDSQLEKITNNKPGHGLIYAGNSIIPFDNEYPRDSLMYKLISSSKTKDKIWNRN